MSRLRVHCLSISLDGYGAGPAQSLDHPIGVGGEAMHRWMFGTRTFQRTHASFAAALFGGEPPREGPDDDYVARGFSNVGAWILGRHMFGPPSVPEGMSPWADDRWKGWWGEEPPYHAPVFVLTHHPRAPIAMAGGTTFHFVTGGIDEALARAREVANGADVRLGGGVATVRQYLSAGHIDELHFAITPVLLGRGEPLLAGIDTRALGYRCTEHVTTPEATHVVLTK